MAKTRIPYHCLELCDNVLLAARGSSIDLFSLESGSRLSTWTCPPTPSSVNSNKKTPVTDNTVGTLPDSIRSATPPPPKRRKLSPSSDGVPDNEKSVGAENALVDVEKSSERRPTYNRGLTTTGLEAPAIIALISAPSGTHVIAVTGEDKSIRVFENLSVDGGKGGLHQISLRSVLPSPTLSGEI